MTTKTQQLPSSSPRMSRLGFGLGLRPTSTAKSKLREDDEWVIPYTGPYEIPQDRRKRDSWGDLITDYGRPSSTRGEYAPQKARQSTSATPKMNRSNSNSKLLKDTPTLDPIQTRRLTHASNFATLTARSFINPDLGGVGASPVNPQRVSPTVSNRASLSSFFTFGSSSHSGTRKSAMTSPATASLPAPPPSASSAQVDFVIESPPSPTPEPDSRKELSARIMPVRSREQAVEEHEYLESYYSSLIPPTVRKDFETPFTRSTTVDRMRDPRPPLLPNQSPATKPAAPHPYAAFTFPSIEPAPIGTTATRIVSSRHIPKESTSTTSARLFSSAITMVSPRVPTRPTHIALSPNLKPSASTPNLRGPGSVSPNLKPFPATVDRWLSTETWCDVLLPKPRFRLQDGTVGSGNPLISPPGSPVRDHQHQHGIVEAIKQRPQREPYRTHKLRKSKSAIDLGLGSRRKIPDFVAMPTDHANKFAKANLFSAPMTTETVTAPVLRGKGRQRSPEPPFKRLERSNSEVVMSLEEVLLEGDHLQKDRAAWQDQATHSFANKRSRSLGRGRAKSLGSHDKRERDSGRKKDTSLEFLAARTLLGSQSVPSIKHHNFASVSSTSHTRRANSKSSHHRGTSTDREKMRDLDKDPSRHKALGIHVVPATMCGSASQFSPTEPKGPFDKAIQSSDTKHISLTDVMNTENPLDDVININADSLLQDDSEVGVAVSSDEHLAARISIPDHPYARSIRTRRKPSVDFVVDMPEPISKSNSGSSMPSTIARSDAASRHRLPPHAVIMPSKQHRHPSTAQITNESVTTSSQIGQVDEAVSAGVSESVLHEMESRPNVDILCHGVASSQTVSRADSTSYTPSSRKTPYAFQHSLPSPSDPEAQYIIVPPRANATSSPQDYQPWSRHGSLTTAESTASSPQASPRPLGHVDDLDSFRDLFYKPDHHSVRNTSSYKPLLAKGGSDAIPNDQRTGLAGLTHRLAEQYELDSATSSQTSAPSIRPPNIFIEPYVETLNVRNEVSYNTSPLRRAGLTAEETVGDERESFRSSASHFIPVIDDTLASVRFGSVPTVTTPPTMDHENRHVSVLGDVILPDKVSGSSSPQQHNTLHPPNSAGYGRSSFGSDSNGSADLRLSDFPEPPPSVMVALQRQADVRDAVASGTNNTDDDNTVS